MKYLILVALVFLTGCNERCVEYKNVVRITFTDGEISEVTDYHSCVRAVKEHSNIPPEAKKSYANELLGIYVEAQQ